MQPAIDKPRLRAVQEIGGVNEKLDRWDKFARDSVENPGLSSAKASYSAVCALKRKLPRQLDTARTTAAKEWVADADVTCGDNVIEAVADFTACPIRRKPACARRIDIAGWVCDKGRQNRIGEVRVIQDIEKVGA